MTHAEHFALSEYLCYIPENMTYDEIIKSLENNQDNEDIELWYLVEDQPGYLVAEYIEATRAHFDRAVKEMTK